MIEKVYIRASEDGNIVTWAEQPIDNAVEVSDLPEDFPKWVFSKYILSGNVLIQKIDWVDPVYDENPPTVLTPYQRATEE